MTLFRITTGKGISCVYKYDHRNRPYLSQKQTLVIPQHSETYIQTQQTSASDASVGAHALTSSGLDQSTNHHGNTDVNNNCDSQ